MVYYTVLAVVVVWGIIALKLAAPVMLLQIGANIAGLVFIISAIHLLYLNTRILPRELRPPTVASARARRNDRVLRILRDAGGAVVSYKSAQRLPVSDS
jgi:membrane protein implicated in regulation of membrane protease activity